MLAYSEHLPSSALARHIRCYWTLCGTAVDAAPERIFPDGAPEIVIHLGDPFLREGERQPRAMFIGEIRRPTVVRPSRSVDIFGIRFRLGGASPLIGAPLTEVRDLIVPLDDVARALGSQLAEASTTAQRIAIVERYFASRVAQPDPRLHAAVRLVLDRRGDVRVRELASTVGASERTLERLFDHAIGFGPKMLARLARFHAAVRGEYDGYYDDAHRNHEFREIAGLTPGELSREQRQLNDAFVGNLQDEASTASLL
ncbi:MAG: helix-turn-helix transcriptional regulator [Thermoanaerobaculia bacterium]|nr:helix-turn-helix transcriptional regulator [Thermoanaerobaculia bacterium]